MADYPKFDLLETADPDEVAVIQICEADNLRKSQMPVKDVTTYALFEAGDRSRVDEYGDYVYTYMTKPGAGLLQFHFAAFKTAAQMRTPFDARPERIGNHRWPDILKALSIIPDYTMPQSANYIQDGALGVVTGPSYRIADEVLPEINEGTLFYVEEFQSHTWFDIPRYRVPQANAVSVSIPGGGRYNHPECWHGKIEVPALATSSATFLSDTEGTAGGGYGAQLLPATNFQVRRPYWLLDEQIRQNGVIYRKRTRVRPPRSSKSQFHLS